MDRGYAAKRKRRGGDEINQRRKENNESTKKRKRGKKGKSNGEERGQRGKNVMCIRAMNVDGLNDINIHGVQQFLKKNRDTDILLLSETKRREDIRNIEFEVEGYDQIVRERSCSQKDGGGLMILHRQGMNIHPWQSPEQDSMIDKERDWCLIKQGGKIAVCNVYLAAESRERENFKDWNERLLRVLKREIEILKMQGFEIVVMGDFNGHCGRTGGRMMMNRKEINSNGREILKLLNESGLWIGNEEQIDGEVFTRYFYSKEGRLLSKAVLDLAVIGEEIERSRIRFRKVEEADEYIETDHKMIEIKIDMLYENVFTRETHAKKSRYKMPSNEEEWRKYTEESEKQIQERGVERVQNSGVYDLTTHLNRIMRTAMEKASPTKGRSAGKARTMELSNEVINGLATKRKWKKKIEEEGVGEEELEQFIDFKRELEVKLREERKKRVGKWRIMRMRKNMTSKSFWEMIRPKRKGKMKISAMRNREGDIEFETEAIGEAVRESFKERLQGEDEPQRLRVDGAEIPGEHDMEMKREVSHEEMMATLSEMKNGRAADEEDIRVELIKFAGPTVKEEIRRWINEVIETGRVPEIAKGSLVKLIYKRNDNLEPSNHRPISISPILLKLTTKIMNRRTIKILERENLLAEEQYGFRPSRSTIDAIFIVSSAMEKARIENVDLHVGFMDMSAAYDRLDRERMIQEMILLGFGGATCKFLQSMYSGDYIRFDINGHKTRKLYLKYGVKQGDSFSSTLFNVSLKTVIDKVNVTKKGIEIGGRLLTCMAFADDKVSLTQGPEDHNQVLQLIESSCKEINMKLNMTKSKLMRRGKGKVHEEIPELEQVAHFKYLGVELQHKMREYQGEYADEVRRKTDNYIGSVKAMAKSCPNEREVAKELWQKVAMVAILYGCEVLPIRKAELDHLESATASVGKFMLGLKSGVANVVAQLAAGLESANYTYLRKVMRYHAKIRDGKANAWVEQTWKEMEEYGTKSAYVKLIRRIEEEILEGEGWDGYEYRLIEYENTRINAERENCKSMCLLPRVEEGKVTQSLKVLEDLGDPVTYMEFVTYDAGLGNRRPVEGISRSKYCLLCLERHKVMNLWEPHVLFQCEAMKEEQQQLGFEDFRNGLGEEIDEAYGVFWRESADLDELESKIEAAKEIREAYWKKLEERDGT